MREGKGPFLFCRKKRRKEMSGSPDLTQCSKRPMKVTVNLRKKRGKRNYQKEKERQKNSSASSGERVEKKILPKKGIAPPEVGRMMGKPWANDHVGKKRAGCDEGEDPRLLLVPDLTRERRIRIFKD